MKNKEKIKQDFFRQFDSQSFRGYPLEQCHSIWEFFERHIGYTEEDVRKAIEVGVNAEAGDYPEGYSFKLGISLEDYFINSLNKKD